MVQTVIYANNQSFRRRLAILTIREHLCGFYEKRGVCVDAGVKVDTESGHTLCCGCKRITVFSGLRECDNCETEYINPNEYQDPHYETICPRCMKYHGF